MIGQGRVCQLIELAGGDISFELPVPFGRIEAREPRPKAGPLFGGQAFDISLQLFDLGHC